VLATRSSALEQGLVLEVDVVCCHPTLPGREETVGTTEAVEKEEESRKRLKVIVWGRSGKSKARFPSLEEKVEKSKKSCRENPEKRD
jgi:hypothetical protein